MTAPGGNALTLGRRLARPFLRELGEFLGKPICIDVLSSRLRHKKTAAGMPRRFLLSDHEEVSVLGRPGSDLLFQVLRLSTIGAGKFNGRVRDGIGFGLPANTTRPAKDVGGIRDQ